MKATSNLSGSRPSDDGSLGPSITPTTTGKTASQKKLSLSFGRGGETDSAESSDSEFELFDVYEGKGMRLLEVEGLQEALESGVCCNVCTGPIVFQEDFSFRQGLCTSPSLFCKDCEEHTYIRFSPVGTSKVLRVNRKVAFANKCAGGNYSSLEVLCAMLDMPPPVSKNIHSQHVKVIREESVLQAQASLQRAREEVCQLYDASNEDDVADIVVSCDGTWQKRGLSSLFGAVFIIAHETGKVIDYIVKSKHCAGCQYWEKRDHSSDAFKSWKETHECDVNHSGSASAMEPQGALEMFHSSLQYKIRFKSLIADGDCKTYSLLREKQPYGSDHPVEKMDCVGHVQKRMETALRNLKVQHRGQKLSDGKTIGGAGRLTDRLINTLQNYYGDAIRRNKGDLEQMMKAVQASLLHLNSSNEHPRHHLCLEGENSWCKWQVARALGKVYDHKDPIPEAIVALLKPIYARLGSRSLLEKCIQGYTQNANEALHQLVWKFCPKELFLGKVGIDIACALAVCSFNDGASSLATVATRLELDPSPLSQHFLKKKDLKRIKDSKYKTSEKGKKQRRAARRKRKGFEDKHKEKEGIMYASGAFDLDDGDAPGPSKRARLHHEHL